MQNQVCPCRAQVEIWWIDDKYAWYTTERGNVKFGSQIKIFCDRLPTSQTIDDTLNIDTASFQKTMSKKKDVYLQSKSGQGHFSLIRNGHIVIAQNFKGTGT